MFQTRTRRQNLVSIHNTATALALLSVRTCWAPCLLATSPTCLHACRENIPEHRLGLVVSTVSSDGRNSFNTANN
jgi:hypothetical protein